MGDPFLTTVISCVCGIAGSLLSFVLVKYVSRRPILIVGAAIQGVCMFIFAIVGVATPGTDAAAKCLVAFVCIFVFTYGATWGPVTFVIVGELPSTKLRSKTVALATSIGWVLNVLISVGMPYLLNAAYVDLGTKVGFIFGAGEVLALGFTIFFLPETKDRTLEEIDEMFLNVSLLTGKIVFSSNYITDTSLRHTESTSMGLQGLCHHQHRPGHLSTWESRRSSGTRGEGHGLEC